VEAHNNACFVDETDDAEKPGCPLQQWELNRDSLTGASGVLFWATTFRYS